VLRSGCVIAVHRGAFGGNSFQAHLNGDYLPGTLVPTALDGGTLHPDRLTA